MARKPDISAYKSFEQISGRLDAIIDQVKSKDTSLERSLDLFDEAIALGSAAVELVDTTDFSSEEEALLADAGDSEGSSSEAQTASGEVAASTEA